jgi:hypothetical protein
MRLEQLYTNFGESSPEQQAAYMASYRLRRAQDLEKVPKAKTKAGVKTSLALTEEEKTIMKILGIKQKDIIAMRAATEVVEEEEVTGDLFNENLEEDE